MRLSAAAAVTGGAIRPVGAEAEFSGLAVDSRRVRPGDLFFLSAKSPEEGRKYVAEATKRGAKAVLTEHRAQLSSLPQLAVADAHAAAAMVSRAFHGTPDRRLRLGAVTGTNGKTTVAWLVRRLTAASGIRCGILGTIEYDVGGRKFPASLTTPDTPELFALLREAAEAGCRAAFMELSSHALVQKRAAGLSFEAAVFTNFTQDHLDYHRTMEEYRAAKGLLFEGLSPSATAVLNADDPAAEYYAARTRARVLRYSLRQPAELRATVLRHDADGAAFRLETPWGRRELHWSPAGPHNVANAAAALAAATVLGADFDAACEALASFPGVPGRLERVGPAWTVAPEATELAAARDAEEQLPFRVLVDYAHTDDALRAVLESLRAARPNRLIVVFGCGGDRDRSKRPKMGRVVEKGADLAVLTSDNPRTEEPHAIIADVLTGVKEPERFSVEADRATAIRLAIREAREGDIVLIAGKGHETYQIVGTEKRPFDDRLCARKALRERLRPTAATA